MNFNTPSDSKLTKPSGFTALCKSQTRYSERGLSYKASTKSSMINRKSSALPARN